MYDPNNIPQDVQTEMTMYSSVQNNFQATITLHIKRPIKITKEDMHGHKLDGVSFEIKDAKGNVVQNNLNPTKNNVVSSKPLSIGSYTLHEVKAPAGYEIASDKPFTINPDMTITWGGATYGQDNQLVPAFVVKDERKKIKVKFKKTDIKDVKELLGGSY